MAAERHFQLHPDYTDDDGNFFAVDTSGQFYLLTDAVLTDDIGEALSRAVVSPGTITGETVREAGLKSDSVLLTRHEIAEFVVGSDQRIASAETSQFTGDN